LKRAAQIGEQVFGGQHPLVAEALDGLGELYREQGQGKLAEALYQRALRIHEQSLNADHSRIASLLNHLGDLYREQGKYKQAEPLYQRALSIQEQSSGSEHPMIAESLNGLANLYREQGQYDQAELLYQRTLTLRRQYLGLPHPKTARTLSDLARLYEKQGDYRQAAALLQDACGVFEQYLSQVHPETVKARHAYQRLLKLETAFSPAKSKELQKHVPPFADSVSQRTSLQHARSPLPGAPIDPLADFLEARCEQHISAWCRSADLWQAYEHWAKEQQERYPLSRGAFTVQLKLHGYRADRTRTARIWRGLALTTKIL
jgi:tetratricopeptide (TPR) repeat protein